MATKETTFTPQDWAEHEKFVQMFRAAKQRKREWQAKIEVKLAEKEERVRRRRAEAEENYIAIIVKRTHPQLPTIIDVFDKQIAMFRANKPL